MGQIQSDFLVSWLPDSRNQEVEITKQKTVSVDRGLDGAAAGVSTVHE